MDLTEPTAQIPSEAQAHHVQSDHPARRTVASMLSVHTTRPFTYYLYLESHAGINTVSGEGKPLTEELQCYEGSSSKDLLSEKSGVRWGSCGMERSCDPPQGMTPFPPPGPVRWPVWLVPLLKDGLQLWEGTAGLSARLAYTAFLLFTNTCTRLWQTNKSSLADIVTTTTTSFSGWIRLPLSTTPKP